MSHHQDGEGLLHPLQKIHDGPNNVSEQKALQALMQELIGIQYKQLFALDEIIRAHIDKQH